MRTYDFILAFDPSGCFREGNGTTGWCVFNCRENKVTMCGSISAKKYACAEVYWDQHLNLIETYRERYKDNMVVVMEDYLLYESKASSQINSRMETCKLIGVLQHYCWWKHIDFGMQLAATVKKRWSNEILCYKKYIKIKGRGYALPDGTIINRHTLDSIRHAIHFATFKNGGIDDVGRTGHALSGTYRP